MNQITHWMDASSIYGSSDSESFEIRERFGGQLKMGRAAGTRLGTLPSCSIDKGKNIGMCTGCSRCFFAGADTTFMFFVFLVIYGSFGHSSLFFCSFFGYLKGFGSPRQQSFL